MTDGRREYFRKTYDSLWSKVHGFDNILIHDDSGDPDYHHWLSGYYNTTETTIYSTGQRSGFGGAIISAWDQLRKTDADWVFHLEEDFTFNKHIDLQAMQKVLMAKPHIVQMALRRQPWNDIEVEAGGVIEVQPESYLEWTDETDYWLQHRNFFTTNPSLYGRSLIDYHEWPNCDRSEGIFSVELFSDPDNVSGYWGSKTMGEWCTHIGQQRKGKGY